MLTGHTFAARMVRAAALVIAFGLAAAGASAQENDTVRESHGDWDILCSAEGTCYMAQTFRNDEGQPVLLVRIQKVVTEATAAGERVEATAQIITPLDVFLPAGLGMQIDEGPVVSAPYVRCREAGCMSNPPLTGELIGRLKQGGVASFIMVRQPGSQPVAAPISLTGFTAAFDAL